MTATDHGVVTRILGADASDQVFLAAVKARNPITLRPNEDSAEETLLGTIVGGDETRLEVEISRLDHHAHALLASPTLFASMDVAANRYVFKTHCVTTAAESDADVLQLVRPAAIAVLERRRSRRRAFRETTELVLQAIDPDAGWRLHADMLNISLNGAACRIREADAAGALGVGETTRVAFSLGRGGRAFDLTARVVSWTPAGTPGNFVVGMEFVDDGLLEANRKRLREALARPG